MSRYCPAASGGCVSTAGAEAAAGIERAVNDFDFDAALEKLSKRIRRYKNRLKSHHTQAMAKQAEAERERRAKIISAEGELQAADKLVEAATKLGSSGAMVWRSQRMLGR